MADKNDTIPGGHAAHLSAKEIEDLVKAANAGDPKAQAYCAHHTALFERLNIKAREEITMDFVLAGYERMEAAAQELHISLADLKKRLGLAGLKRSPVPQPQSQPAQPGRKIDKKPVEQHPFELKKAPIVPLRSATDEKMDKLAEELLTGRVILQQERQDMHDIADRHVPIAAPLPESLNTAIDDIDEMVERPNNGEGLPIDHAMHPHFPGDE